MSALARSASDASLPTVSVIVAVHDVADHVATAIASLRAQTLPCFEALVIDDGSTDRSGDVARRAVAGDPRFRLIRQDNRGLSAARNAGLELARGDWLAFLDGDDALAPTCLQDLLAAARAAGQPWAMSALSLWPGRGAGVAHSGIHGSPDPGAMTTRVIALTDARQVARLFPSAWGKLYARGLFDGLRFPEGSWYEDHEPFWHLSARTRAILHLPRQLYLHRRDRPGQITDADDDRVFQQFGVLDRLQPLIARFDHPRAGAAQLASRLIHERAAVLRQPARRAAFVARARDWLAGQGLRYDPGVDGNGDHGLSAALAVALEGQVACSVIWPGAAPTPDGRGWLRDAEMIALPELAPEPEFLQDMSALAARLRGRYALFAPPGSEPLGIGPESLLEAGLRRDADLVLGQLETAQGCHDGWMDNRLVIPAPAALAPGGTRLEMPPEAVLRLHPSCARILIRTDLLARLGWLSVPLTHPLAGAELILRAALGAGHVLALPLPAARVQPAQVAPGMALAWAAGLDLGPAGDGLPPGWRTVLALRALRPGLPPARSAGGIRARLVLAASLYRAGLRASGGAIAADPGTDRLLARIAGLRLSPP